MSNIEIPKLNIEPEASPEQEAEMIRQRDLLTKKLADIDAALAVMKHDKINTYAQHLEDKEQLSEKMGTIAEALSQENLQKAYSQPAIIITPPETAPSPTPIPVKTELEQEVDHTFIENTGPDLERSRSDYAEAIFKNKLIIEPANQVYLESLRKKYEDNITVELEKVTPENEIEGKRIAMTKARLAFLKQERETFNNEIFKLENEETKKRIGKALEKGLEKTGQAVGKVGEVVGTRVNNVLDAIKNIKPDTGKGMGWLYELLRIAAIPVVVGLHYGNKIGDKISDSVELLKKKFNQVTSPEEKKPVDIKEKYGNKKVENPAPTKPVGPKRNLDHLENDDIELTEKQKRVFARKNEFLEKAFGAKLSGDNNLKWGKLSRLSVGSFFSPEENMGKKVTDYPPFAQKIYEKLHPLYQEESTTIKSTTKLLDYLTSLAEQDKLKDLWNQTSSNNS